MRGRVYISERCNAGDCAKFCWCNGHKFGGGIITVRNGALISGIAIIVVVRIRVVSAAATKAKERDTQDNLYLFHWR